MNRELQNANDSSESSQLEEMPDKADYPRLKRTDRIYYAMKFPRHFQLTDSDDRYFYLMRCAYNIMISAPTEFKQRLLISHIVPGKTLSPGETYELIHSTKEYFGKVAVRNEDFDRDMMRHKLEDLAHRAQLAGDIKNERLAYKQLVDLDALAKKENAAKAPEIPPVPEVVLTTSTSDIEPAIVESSPASNEEE